MWYALVITVHVVGAVGALTTGTLAFTVQNNALRHRLLGKLYLVSWLMLGSAGVIIGSWHPGITVFEVLNALGLASTVYAYSFVVRRKQLGRTWLRGHYRWMLTSLAFVVVATINQVLPRMGIEYPIWVFYLLVAAPVPLNIVLVRRLDQRYRFTLATKGNSAQTA